MPPSIQTKSIDVGPPVPGKSRFICLSAGKPHRLLSEAGWKYAARAGDPRPLNLYFPVEDNACEARHVPNADLRP